MMGSQIDSGSGKFRFVGEDRSRGYRNGEVYDLVFFAGNKYRLLVFDKANDGKVCPYSMTGFMKNWKLVRSD